MLESPGRLLGGGGGESLINDLTYLLSQEDSSEEGEERV
jgi:hypothetical protein